MILVVDGQNLAHAMNMTRELFTSYGIPTHAVIGFLRTLGNICAEFEATQIFVTWDGGRSVERTRLYPEYKANRDAKKKDPEWLRKNEALKQQIKIIRRLVNLLGVRQAWGEGIEGDDIVSVVVNAPHIEEMEKLIFSADKDFWQLVRSDVSVLNPINNNGKRFVSFKRFKEITGLLSKQYLDFKSMVGDRSDNIPGCKGVGEKTALGILQQFVTYEDFIQSVETGAYSPTALEKRAFDDRDGFMTARTLMDLNHIIQLTTRKLYALAGEKDIEAFKRQMAELEVNPATTTGIVRSFGTIWSEA